MAEYTAGASAKSASSGLERVAAFGAGALGLVGYLYALGGVVVWLRVQTAELAPDGAIVAADDKHLLAIGVRVVAFELFLLIAIGAIVAVLVGVGVLLRRELPEYGSAPDAPSEAPDPSPTRKKSRLEEIWDDERTLGGFIGPVTSLLLIAVGLSLQDPDWVRQVLWIAGVVIGLTAALAMIFHRPPEEPQRQPGRFRTTLRRISGLPFDRPVPWREWLSSIGAKLKPEGLQVIAVAMLSLSIFLGIFVVPLLQGTVLLAGTVLIYVGPFLRWPDKRDRPFGNELLRAGGFWTAVAAATVVALAWVATPPVTFTHAVVEPADHSKRHPGAYLDRADGGVYLGTCTVGKELGSGHRASTESRITLVPVEESVRVRLGQETYSFDPGGRPSIWQTIKATVGGGSAGVHDAPLHHPLRGQVADVCGSGSEPEGLAAATSP